MNSKPIQKIDSFDLDKIRIEATEALAKGPVKEEENTLHGKPFEIHKFINFASNLINRKFEIDDKNIKVVESLWDYFFNPAKFDSENSVYSSGKGIMLYGAPGSGKTELMRIFYKLAKGDKSIEFEFGRFYNISFKVQEKMADRKTNKGNIVFPSTVKNYCFDELGLERCKKIKMYSETIDIDEEIIFIRYDEFRNGTVTHFTTNLTADMIKQRYDARVVSRLNEMCNLMSLTGVDRRATARPVRRY